MAYKLLCGIHSVLSKSGKPVVTDYLNEVIITFTWEVTFYLHKRDENQTYANILKQMIRSKFLSPPMTGYLLTVLDEAHMNGYLPTVDLDEWGISETSEMFPDNVDTNKPAMLLLKGRIHALNHQHKEAINCFEQHLRKLGFLQEQGTVSSASIVALWDMAKSYSKIKLFDRSIDLLKKALRLDFLNHGRHGKDNTFICATLYMSLGNEYFNLHRYDWAEKAYRTSLRIFTQIGNACCLSTCDLYKMLHLIYLGRNDPITAELYKRKQLALECNGIKVT